jgi:hypothetical protein
VRRLPLLITPKNHPLGRSLSDVIRRLKNRTEEIPGTLGKLAISKSDAPPHDERAPLQARAAELRGSLMPAAPKAIERD